MKYQTYYMAETPQQLIGRYVLENINSISRAEKEEAIEANLARINLDGTVTLTNRGEKQLKCLIKEAQEFIKLKKIKRVKDETKTY